MTPFLKLGRRDTAFGSGMVVRQSIDDRRRHVLVSGKPGTGKSTFLANLFAQDANSGRGALLIDPHGELAEMALNLVPPARIRKTIYLNPADSAHPIGFNVLADVHPEDRASRADDIVAAFRSVWSASWGPRLEHILYNTIAALLESNDATLLCIPRMLLNRKYRERVVRRVRDPIIAQFWREEFPLYEKKFGAEAISPVLNKIGQVLSSPMIRNIVGQPRNSMHPRHLMDNNYLVITNLSKGRLGEQHANLLGALLISSFGAAALSRSDIPDADERKDFAMIVDEFHNYTTDAFASLLAEARKYRLSLTLAHQYLQQMSDEVKAAVLGNCGSLIVFRTGAQDAPTFARELWPLNAEQLSDVANHEAWVRVMQYGEPSDTFKLRTLPPPPMHGHAGKIIRQSRIHFASSRYDVEERIARFLSGKIRDDDQEAW